jgi:hypothetical protein
MRLAQQAVSGGFREGSPPGAEIFNHDAL